MAGGISKPNQAQGSKHKVRRERRRAEQITERNKIWRIMREMKRRVGNDVVLAMDNAALVIRGDVDCPREIVALNRLLAKTGIARGRDFIKAFPGKFNAFPG